MLTPTASANLLFEIAKDALLAGLTAWLTVRQALKQFSSQRWWERQEDAYRKIIDSLSQIQLSLASMSNMGVLFVSTEEQLRHWAKVAEKVEDLKRIFHEGAFRISKKSNTALQQMIGNWYAAPPLGDGLEQDDTLTQYGALVITCRDIIDAEARRDLGLPRQH
jgi:hypothetical protein